MVPTPPLMTLLELGRNGSESLVTRKLRKYPLLAECRPTKNLTRLEIYIGQVIWNRRRMKSVPGTSKRVAEIRPRAEWIIREHPELRIIDDALWNRVQTRLSRSRRKAHAANKQPRGRPSKYLLSGLMVCGECGANYIMRDTRAYACSSHANGGRHLCDNGIRVSREIAESVILEKLKDRLLGDDVVKYVTEQFRQALKELDNQPDDSVLLKSKLLAIDARLAKLADAVEIVGISDTLVDRLTKLEREKAETEMALQQAPAPVNFLPEVIPTLVRRWQELVISIESVAENPQSTRQDIEAARAHLRALLGTITLKPRNGTLWAHPAPNKNGLVETRPLEGLRINSPFFGSGGRI